MRRTIVTREVIDINKISIACGVECVIAGPLGGLRSADGLVFLRGSYICNHGSVVPGVVAPGAVIAAMAISVPVQESCLAASGHVAIIRYPSSGCGQWYRPSSSVSIFR